ncbi:hypothetical protein [Streptomyces sp. bgisy031]|uniref:hypothetical protein n=1 Tax=Streptomyces sp. bgisy031 TaxID=3413772 RepID=UPI003D74997E
MKKSLRSRTVASLAAAAAISLAIPGAANAADHSAKSASFTDGCATGMVTPISTWGQIRALAKNNARILEAVPNDQNRVCSPNSTVVGDPYKGCGYNRANGWIKVKTFGGQWGWVAMTCWDDTPF